MSSAESVWRHKKRKGLESTTRGVFRGGPLGHGPPFGSQGLQNCIVKWAKLRHGPLLCKLGIRLLAGNLSEFGWKTGRTLSKDLFFFFSFFFFGDHLILGRKNLWISAEKSLWILAKTFFFFVEITWFDFWQKKPLNFGFRPKNHSELWRRPFFFFFFFFEITQFWAEKSFEFPSFPRHFASSFGQTVWNWFKFNENSSQGRLHTSHSF